MKPKQGNPAILPINAKGIDRERKVFYSVGDGEQRISLCSRENVIDVVEACIGG